MVEAALETKWQETAAKANVSADRKPFIAKVGPAIEAAFIRKGETPERAAELAKYSVAQCALESRWGLSGLSAKDNNFAGIKVGSGAGKGDTWNGESVNYSTKEKNGTETEKADFRKYETVDEFANDYVRLVNLDRYKSALGTQNPFDFAMTLGRGGYHQDKPGGYAADVTSGAAAIFPEYKDKYAQYVRDYSQAVDVPESQREAVSTARKGEVQSYAKDVLNDPNRPVGEKIMFALFLMIVGLFNPEMAAQLSNMMEGKPYGVDASVGSQERAARLRPDSKYNPTGQIGGKVAGYDFELPAYKEGQSLREYVVANARSLIGQREVGDNRGPYVDWIHANAGLSGSGAPHCGSGTSKVFEGTRLFNYTASSLNFLEQGLATNSSRYGIQSIDGIKPGDPIVFDRGTVTDYQGHVGTVVDIKTDAGGKVVGLTTVESNNGAVVKEFNYTVSGGQLLRENGKDSRFIGYIDAEHREDVLLQKGILKERVVETLAKNYNVKAPEQQEPEVQKADPKKDQAAINEDIKARALEAVSGISKENQVTDKESKTPSADKNPAETLAMHSATLLAVNSEAKKAPPAAKTDAAKTSGTVLA